MLAYFLTWTWTELDLQGPENFIGCKRNVFPAGTTSVGVPVSLASVAPHKASHAFKKAFANTYRKHQLSINLVIFLFSISEEFSSSNHSSSLITKETKIHTLKIEKLTSESSVWPSPTASNWSTLKVVWPYQILFDRATLQNIKKHTSSLLMVRRTSDWLMILQ